MRAVNLLPRQTSGAKIGWNSELVAAVAFTVVVLVGVLGGFFVEKSNASAQKQQLATAQAALDRAKSNVSTQARLQIPDVLQQSQPWHLALNSALSTRVAWDVLLTRLEYVVPSKVILTSVSFGAAASTTTAPTTTLTIGGNTFSVDDVAVLLARLERVPNLSQVKLVSTTSATGSGMVSFQISAQVTLPATVVAPAAPVDTTTTGGSA